MILYLLRLSKYVKYIATMTYGICHTPLFGYFCSSSSSSSNSVELAYRKSGTSTVLGFYMKRLLSLACVILDQENLRNFTHNCIYNPKFSLFVGRHFLCGHVHSRFIERWGSSARRSTGVEAGGARVNTSK